MAASETTTAPAANLGELAIGAARGIQEQVQAGVEKSPYGAVAAAIGIGYVLGGGIFTPLTGRALGLGLRLGLRLVVLPLVSQRLAGLAQGVADDGHAANDESL